MREEKLTLMAEELPYKEVYQGVKRFIEAL